MTLEIFNFEKKMILKFNVLQIVAPLLFYLPRDTKEYTTFLG